MHDFDFLRNKIAREIILTISIRQLFTRCIYSVITQLGLLTQKFIGQNFIDKKDIWIIILVDLCIYFVGKAK